MEQEDCSVGCFSTDSAVLKHHGEEEAEANVSRHVRHRPHQREEGHTKKSRRGEHLNEIGQTDEGLVTETGGIRIGEREPKSVEDGIEGQHRKRQHGGGNVRVG